MSEVRLSEPLRATYVEFPAEVEDFFDLPEEKRTAGAWYFDGEFFHYCCPCGCKHVGLLRAATPNKPSSSPSWAFNGNNENPTLTPSIHHVGHWHGFLTDGYWRQA